MMTVTSAAAASPSTSALLWLLLLVAIVTRPVAVVAGVLVVALSVPTARLRLLVVTCPLNIKHT